MDTSRDLPPVRLPNPTAESFVTSLKVVHFFAIIFYWLLMVALLLHLVVFVLVQFGAFDQTQEMSYNSPGVLIDQPPQADTPDGATLDGNEAASAPDDQADSAGGTAEADESSGPGWWTKSRAESLLFYLKPLMAAMRLVGLVASMLLLVTLFLYLQISLLGRLAGVRYLTVAFFLMMFCVATVFSWEPLLPGTRILGSLYIMDELLRHNLQLSRDGLEVAYYWFRFLILPIASLVLLVASWLRFRKGYEESVLMNE